MLPKNTFRQRRLDRLKVFPGQAPDSYLENVVETWRDGSNSIVPPMEAEGVQAEVGGR
jgi:large subunit ribosomal protein L13